MNETEFNAQVDDLMLAIEDAIDDSGANIDYESSGGVMTLTCENDGSKIIISRQPALREIWVAARSGGYHCAQVDDRWACSVTGETFSTLLNRVCSEQLQEAVELGNL